MDIVGGIMGSKYRWIIRFQLGHPKFLGGWGSDTGFEGDPRQRFSLCAPEMWCVQTSYPTIQTTSTT